jgi:hypothetical protein
MIIVSGLRAGLVIGLIVTPLKDPARAVPLEQEVRQGRQQHAGRVGRLPDQPRVPRDVGLGDPADQELRHQCRVRCAGPLAATLRGCDADLTLVEDVVADPVPDPGLGDRLAEQLLGVEDLDAAVAHHLDERVVLRFGPGHPDHVIEQQFPGVRRGQAGVLESRPVHDHLAQRAHFRMHSKWHADYLVICPAGRCGRLSGGTGWHRHIHAFDPGIR